MRIFHRRGVASNRSHGNHECRMIVAGWYFWQVRLAENGPIRNRKSACLSQRARNQVRRGRATECRRIEYVGGTAKRGVLNDTPEGQAGLVGGTGPVQNYGLPLRGRVGCGRKKRAFGWVSNPSTKPGEPEKKVGNSRGRAVGDKKKTKQNTQGLKSTEVFGWGGGRRLGSRGGVGNTGRRGRKTSACQHLLGLGMEAKKSVS